MAETSFSQNLSNRLQNWVARGFIGALLALPYATRVRLSGWIFAHLVGPLSGARRRIRKNLSYAWPDLPQSEVDRLCRAVPDNLGRTLIEIYSGQAFSDRVKDVTPHGPGTEALAKGIAEGQPMILISGHFGNYDVARSYMLHQGRHLGGLFREMKNPYFNAHYVKAIRKLSEPMWTRSRRGMAEMVKFLRGGGAVALVTDQYNYEGQLIDFFGKPARTALSAAELALKYKTPLIPMYMIRQPDGLSFEIYVDTPIEHSDAPTMMQQFHDGLEAVVRKHPEQWLWIHRRWRPERDDPSDSGTS
jgi:KDO2-lipid IV(A) lauroyltransferase